VSECYFAVRGAALILPKYDDKMLTLQQRRKQIDNTSDEIKEQRMFWLFLKLFGVIFMLFLFLAMIYAMGVFPICVRN
jgi:hypothetical protein